MNIQPYSIGLVIILFLVVGFVLYNRESMQEKIRNMKIQPAKESKPINDDYYDEISDLTTMIYIKQLSMC